MQDSGSELRRIPLPRTSVNRGRCLRSSRAALLLAHHQHGAVCVPHNRVRYAARKRPSYPSYPPSAHDDQTRSYLLGQGDYLRVWTPCCVVRAFHLSPRGLDLAHHILQGLSLSVLVMPILQAQNLRDRG